MTTPKSSTPQPGDSTHPKATEITSERIAAVDFDLFGQGGATEDGAIDLAAEARASAAAAADQAVDFDVFGISESPVPAATRLADTAITPARPAVEDDDIGFEISRAGKTAGPSAPPAPDDDDEDMNADDATRFHAPPRERAANAPPSASPIPAPRRAPVAATQAASEGSGNGKIVAIIVLVIAALAAAWWFLR